MYAMKKTAVRSVVVVVILLAIAVIAETQQSKKVPRIGYLATGLQSVAAPNIDAFRQGLRELGYVEGKNIEIEWRFGGYRVELLSNLATELVRLKVDMIVATGGPAVRAAKKETSTIPIVMAFSGDPVGTGLVPSLARPGGNITGLSYMAPDLSAKRLELLKEAFPKVSRVAVLFDVTDAVSALEFKETQVAAQALGVTLQSMEVRGPEDFESAFLALARERANGLLTFAHALTIPNRKQIADLAAKSRLPAMYGLTEFAEAGGLMAYGPNLSDLFRRAATYVDKILKGAKPADLPVEQPIKFEFVINLKTAKQIGVTIPPNVLARADKVIK
jgi:putative tryptophan/tyrosine transport system substrate-binding protein